MGTLPKPRLEPNKVFHHVGVDLGGPFNVKEHKRRNAKLYKVYLCLFVCFSTKAVHLEVLTDLSSDCFLACLDRFTARRGLCSSLYSDCGTNFVAANKHLQDVVKFLSNNGVKTSISDGCSARGITWKFNPPSAPSMGGLWEAGIKSAKYHLLHVAGDKSLTFEELSTLFRKVEAVMNSRPLCSLSDNPNEFEVLTAGHFLIGQSLLAVPEHNLEDVPINLLSRWQYIQKCSQSFWKLWSHDYLHTLQQRSKWHVSPPNLKSCMSIFCFGYGIPMVIILYYILGVVGFGVLRSKNALDCAMFPLEFTTTGGLAQVESYIRVLYGVYVEGAMCILSCTLATIRRYSTKAITGLTDNYRLFTVDKCSKCSE
ncbi:uncharacterized protein LOC126970850 isoform X1 [Leptidea sinapis]|uniref:uncharacterized protein LOC126970850 isoform X1 n=1 Tax=Leptidea sinapis TaxID=189913 RepID=UPI0021C45F95|nr:uncharacterized protein LOC126970850 isoform X1 [Leptidea sinapis]